MRTTIAAVLSCAVLLAGCDVSSTGPVERRPVPTSPERILIASSGWTMVSLPFKPAAINDGGVVVGTSNDGTEAVRWENGTLIKLPHLAGLPGPYSARDITAKGLILGAANGHALIWTSPTAAPMDIAVAGSSLTPLFLNDSYMIVGMRCQLSGCGPWQWVKGGVVTTMATYASTDSIELAGLNASGYTVGTEVSGYWDYYVERWSPGGQSTRVSSIAPCPGPDCWEGIWTGDGINDRGDMVVSEWSNLNVRGQAPEGVWILWQNGSETAIRPTSGAAGISNAGRVIGLTPWTYFGGTMSTLSYPDDTTHAPRPVDVNTCGSIVAVRDAIYGGGYLWRRGGITATCDVMTSTL